jgi:hypothetical protein
MQSQQASIIALQAGSPLVHVMQTPSFIGSHLHIPIARLQQHISMPFIIMQQLHMPPAIIEQRFWSIVADTASSHLHVIFIPPAHFSILILHRGTIIHCGAADIPAAVPIGPVAECPIPGIPMPARSITIALVIFIRPQRCFADPNLKTTDVPVASSSKKLRLSPRKVTVQDQITTNISTQHCYHTRVTMNVRIGLATPRES